MTRQFRRFASKASLADHLLIDAIVRADAGSIDADLGGGLIKQRVARRGQGRRGGYRTILLFRREDKAVFLYGFAKNEMDNVSEHDLGSIRTVAREINKWSNAELKEAMDAGKLSEIS